MIEAKSVGGFTLNKEVKRVLTVILIAIGALAVLSAIFWGAGYLIFSDTIGP